MKKQMLMVALAFAMSAHLVTSQPEKVQTNLVQLKPSAAQEARIRFAWASGKVPRRLQQNPGAFQSLTSFRSAVEHIQQSRVQVLTIAPALVVAAAGISQQVGLLINDALIVAVMQANGLTRLASNDADFDRVPGITRYAPL